MQKNAGIVELDERAIIGSRSGLRPNMIVQGQFTIPLVTRIRHCLEEDLPALEWFGMFTAHREIIRSAFDAQMSGKNLMLVAETNGFPVGQLWIDLAKKRRESVGILWALRVFPLMQNLGIGTRLIAAAERLLRERGVMSAELGVDEKNTSAFRLYERLGYKFIGRECGSCSDTTPGSVLAGTHSEIRVLRKDL